MYCSQCGQKLETTGAFCPNCGARLNTQAEERPNGRDQRQNSQHDQQYGGQYGRQNNQQYGQQQYQQYGQQQYGQQYGQQYQQYGHPPAASVNFGEAIRLFFVNYVNFTGRATKSEYWWAFLFQVIVSVVAGWIPVIGWLIGLGLLIPNLSIGIRRLHDIGKPWPYYLLGLIPLAGPIILIVYFCKDSDGDNQWGPDPRRG